MEVQSRYFGLIEYDSDDCLHFESGLFGFADEKEFLLLPFENDEGVLLSLQSTKTPMLNFLVLNPFVLYPEYEPQLSDAELKSLGVKESGELGYYVLCVLKKPVEETTVNMKCPLAINPETREAMQVILDNDAYDMRQPLHTMAKAGVESC